MQLRFIDHGETISYSVLTEITIIGNDKLTEKFEEYESKGLASLGRMLIVTALNDYVKTENPEPFVLEDSFAKTQQLVVHDAKTGIGFDATISSMRLGEDTGMNTLIDWTKHIEMTLKDLINSISPEERTQARKFYQGK